MSSSSSQPRRSRGRGGGGGGRGGRNNKGRRGGGGQRSSRSTAPSEGDTTAITDEEILIAFAPYMRNEDPEAVAIHQRHENNIGGRQFLHDAREFLMKKRNETESSGQHQQQSSMNAESVDASVVEAPPALQQLQQQHQPLPAILLQPPVPSTPPPPAIQPSVDNNDDDLISRLDKLIMSSEDDPVIPLSQTPPTIARRSTAPIGSPSGAQTMTLPIAAAAPLAQPPISSQIPQISSPIQRQQQQLLIPMLPGLQQSGNSLSTPHQTERTPAADSPILPERTPPPATTPSKPKFVPKRLWTRPDQQPGRVLVGPNDIPFGQVIDVRPRAELSCKWMLPISYLETKGSNVQKATQNLAVGLYRRGCTENGTNHSIISKDVQQCRVDTKKQIVWGTLPFYAPRTPGNVVLRLYWTDAPLHTLATSCTLNVRVGEMDLETSLRFILSNFKSKKGTGISSLNSLVLVLENFAPSSNKPFDQAGRAAWGCICESRKVLEACGVEYLKQSEKLSKLESEIESIKLEQQTANSDDNDKEEEIGQVKDVGLINWSANKDENGDLDLVKAAKTESEKKEAKVKLLTRQFMVGRAANDRKWRDAQSSFASILKAVCTNRAMSLLLKREHIVMLRLELELWCPLCEMFAPSPFTPSETSADHFFRPTDVLAPITGEHFEACAASRKKMQLESLGFVPNRLPLEQILMPGKPDDSERQINPTAVESFNGLSAAMGQLYQEQYFVSDRIHQQRELVRSHVESMVNSCDAFPSGTKVIVFGSSANGFGSPSSDIDMCLQLPPNGKLTDEEDSTGAIAMSKLAKLFEQQGMKDVNSDRLTARIPILMFACPRPMATEGEDEFVECDLSMQNPLACLNTSLLLNYSQIHVLTRVLASIIKRWAKNRDMNSPHKHTLSTYGYLIMLLHFLTYHKRTGKGLVTSVQNRSDQDVARTPLLPNLQWMNPRWPQSPPGTPYQELAVRPQQNIPHPIEQGAENNVIANTYFYRLSDQHTMSQMQRLFPGQDLSLSILLASFFYYYAYEFNYKKHVVSLQSTESRGLVEREVKAEMDGWKLYGTSLAIEDPFETFYDVAHVLKGGNFHRLQNEFAMAYSKIADVALGKSIDSWGEDVNLESKRGMDLLDWICEPYVRDEEEQG